MAYSIKYLTQCYFLQIIISLFHFAQLKKKILHMQLHLKKETSYPLEWFQMKRHGFKSISNSDKRLAHTVKGWAQNRGLFDRKFKIVRIGRFWRFLCHWTRKICAISWVFIKNSRHKNSAYQLTQNSNVDWNFYSKFGKISNIEWAPQIKMD